MNEIYRVWTGTGQASPLSLTLNTGTLPQPAEDEVLVRNLAIGLNPVDWKLLDTQAGKVPGVDGAGVVIAVGANITSDWLGERVTWHQSLKRHGSFATHTPLSASALMRVPPGLDIVDAAAFPCPALTAWQALEKIPSRRKERLLISGAGGSVGHWLVQFARERGFIIDVMCNERHRDRLLALGAAGWYPGPLADEEPLPEALRTRYYAAFDAVSGAHGLQLSETLSANGHLVTIQDRVERWPNPAFGRALSLHEVALGALHFHGDERDWRQLTRSGERLLDALAQGTFCSETLLVRDFNSLPEHLQALKNRSFSGKLVITL